MAYDFSNLTLRQQEVLTFQGWHVGSKFPAIQPQPATVRKLIERGLVLAYKTVNGVTEYHVPLDVHMAWCDHCSRQSFDEAA